MPSPWETAEGRGSPGTINSRTGMKDQGPEDTWQSQGAQTSYLGRDLKENLLVQPPYKPRADKLPQTSASPLEWGETSIENKKHNPRETKALQMA